MVLSPLVAGIDLGGTKILGRLVDPAEPIRPIYEHRVDTPRGASKITDAIESVVLALNDWSVHHPSPASDRERARERPPIAAVGIGAAGLVDLRGVLRFAPNLPTVVDLDLGSELERRLGVPVAVDNDANCATWAEVQLGGAQGANDAVMVTLGTGIGGGFVVGGSLQRGAFGFAGEPGHMLIDPNGPPCPCGRRGCWERFASGSGIGRLARDAAGAGRADRVVELAGGDPEAVRGEHVTTAAAEGDTDAIIIVEEFAWWVAVGVANLVNLLDPEVVVIGGGLVDAGELLMQPVRSAYDGLVLAVDHRPRARIEAARLGSEAGAIGAGLLAAAAIV